jgi:protein O-GlcNAc transferase
MTPVTCISDQQSKPAQEFGSLEDRLAYIREAILRKSPAAAKNELSTILEEQPEHAEALHLLGLVHAQEQCWPEAAASLRRALEIDPCRISWHIDLAIVLTAMDKLRSAAAVYVTVLTYSPDELKALIGLGSVLLEVGEAEKAHSAFSRAAELQPRSVEAQLGNARTLVSLGRSADAIELLKGMLAENGECIDVQRVLGSILYDQGDLPGAQKYWEAVLRGERRDTEALTYLFLIAWKTANLEQVATYARPLIASGAMDETYHSIYLYLLLFRDGETAESIRSACEEFGRRLGRKRGPPQPFRKAHNQNKRLRIGYVSGESASPVSRNFLMPFLLNHDHRQFDVHFYDTARQCMWPELPGKARHCYSLDNEALRQTILEDEIDILVDLSGMFPGNRLQLFAWRSAPLQVTYPNCPITTGIEEIDYIFTDEWTCPSGHEGQYKEKAVRLPCGYLAYEPPADAPSISPSPASSNGFMTYGLFQRTLKINSGVWDVIAGILQRDPSGLLLIQNPDPAFDDPKSSARRAMAAELALRGIGSDRVRLLGPRCHSEFLRVIAEADIALDTFPYQGQTTTCECLWMGVPVVTLAGDRHSARVGSAIVQRIGLGELVTATRDEYVEGALRLAQDTARLASLRSGLRHRLACSSLLDSAGLMRAIEQAYHWMWNSWCSQ